VDQRLRRKRCKYGVGLEPEGMWNRLEVQKVLDGGKYFVVRGWFRPIPARARTELPPDPGKPVYGPAAREEARRIIRDAKRAKINLGWPTKVSLLKVIHGKQPLSYSLWDQTQAYVRRVSSERERERDLRERPMAVDFRGLLAHQGSGLAWRERQSYPPTPVNPPRSGGRDRRASW
jgi:hypothetical protein